MIKSCDRIGNKRIGPGAPVFVIAEIGINHNGSIDTAKRLIDGAVIAGADAVKFQKRTPELCVPREQQSLMRDTPWGRMTYLEYKHRVELDYPQYVDIDRYCKERNILWFASCWDEPSVDFIEQFDPPCHKAASASLTDHHLLGAMRRSGRPLVLSTGMSSIGQVQHAVDTVGRHDLLLAHCTSAYPCPPEQLNLLMIETLQHMFPSCPVGYSGHEMDLAPTWAAVALGASFVERHITLDRHMWGSDQAASIEIHELITLVSNIRRLERSLGDGVKRIYPSEQDALKRLRRVNGTAATQEAPELAAATA